MRRIIGSLLVLSICSCSLSALAKSSKAPADAEAKKKAVIDKIIQVVEDDKLTAEERKAAKQKKKERIAKFGNFIADKLEIPEAKREEIHQKMREQKKKHKDLPPEVKEEMKRKLDIAGFNRRAAYQVLSDHLDEKDLKNVLKFMKSSTGTKLVKEAPDMLLQFGILAGEHFLPIAIDFFKGLKMMHNLMPLPMPGGLEGDPKNKQIIDQMRKLMEQQRQKTPQTPPPSPPDAQKKDNEI